MKLIIRLAIAGTAIIFVTSCSEVPEKNDGSIETIYENEVNKGTQYPSLLDDNLIKVERIGIGNRIADNVISELRYAGLDPVNLDLNNLMRFQFNYTGCNVYSIQEISCEEKIILYEYDGVYLTARASFSYVSDTIQIFEMTTLDGNLCYSIEISANNRIGEIRINDNPGLDQFRSAVSDRIEHEKLLKGVNSDYCRQEESWSACFECIMEYCSSKWYCSIAVAVYPLEFIAGFAASCIGASPTATP